MGFRSLSPRHVSTLALACMLGAACLGCSKNATKPKPSSSGGYLNPEEPNANTRILSQATIGDPTKYSSIYSLGIDATGQYFFRGEVDGRTGVGILSSSGSLLRFESTIYSARDFWGLSSTAPSADGSIVVGALDSDGDGLSETGYASLFSHSGSLTDQLLFSSDSSDVWLNGIASVTDSTFIVVGGERRRGTEYPYLALLLLTSEPKLVLRARAVFESQAGRYFSPEVVVFPAAPGTNELSLCALSEGTGQATRIEEIRTTLPALDPVVVEWREIVGPFGPEVSLAALDRVGDNVFVVGEVDDNRKPALANGIWDSGLVASYTRQGDLRWLTVASVSTFEDAFSDLVAGPDGIYAVGSCARFVHLATQVFSYGLISRIDPNTGQVLANMSLGQDRFETAFNTGALSGGALACGGWTERETTEGPFKALWCRVNVAATAAPLAATSWESPTALLRADPKVAPPARPGDRELR